MLLVEGLLLTAAGGALGLFLGIRRGSRDAGVFTLSLPGVQDVASTRASRSSRSRCRRSTAIVFGLAPLVVSERRELTDLLREGGSRNLGGARQHRLQAILVVSSVALAFVLLASAGLLMRSFDKLMAVDTGIHAPRVLTMQVRLPQAGYDSAPAVRSFYQGCTRTCTCDPVGACGLHPDGSPLKGDGERRAFTADQAIDASDATGSVAVTWTFGDYFRTFGVPIVRGRGFLPEEDAREPADGDREPCACGTLLARAGPNRQASEVGNPGVAGAVADIVGVAGDVVDGKLGEPPIMHIYVPFAEAVNPAGRRRRIAGLVRRMTVAA